MSLWQEIIFLANYFNGKYCIENVISYYDPPFEPIEIGRHYFWTNFNIPKINQPKIGIGKMCGKNQTASKKPLQERNMVNAKLGLHILDCAMNIIRSENVSQMEIF